MKDNLIKINNDANSKKIEFHPSKKGALAGLSIGVTVGTEIGGPIGAVIGGIVGGTLGLTDYVQNFK